MTLWTKTGVLTKDATSGAHNQTFTNVWTEAPKVLFIWATKNTSTNTYAEGVNYSFGYSDGTTSACIAQCSRDNQVTAACSGVIRDDAIIEIMDETSPAAPFVRGTVSSWNTTDLVINWGVANTTQYVFQYYAIGGSDITNAKVVNATAGRTTTGTQDYASFGFTPTAGDIVFMMAATDAGASAYSTYMATANCVAFGAAMSTTSRWNVSNRIRSGAVSSECKTRLGVDTLSWCSGSSDTVTNASDFSAWISGGVRLNHTTAYASTANPVSLLIIDGGEWDIGTFAQRSGSGTQDVTTTTGRTAQGVCIWGTRVTSTNTPTQLFNNSIGACDTATENCISIQDVAASDPMILSQRSDNTKVGQNITAAATATSSTLVSEADVSAMSPTTGKFTLDWTTGDTTLRQHAWFAASGTAGAGTTPVSQTNIHKYNMLQYVAPTSIQKYNLRAYLSQTSIQKYTLRNFVAITTGIHKYNLRRFIPQTIIHKYNLRQFIPQTTIQKYNLRRFLSQTSIQKYNARRYVQAGKARLVIHIPLYIYPFHWIPGNEWQQVSDLIAANPDIDFIIKINPNSGPDTSLNTDFIAGLNILTAGSNPLHMKIIGYVYTSYGDRPIADVKTDIDRYVSFYGSYLRGIFLDEMEDDPGDESYYQEITAYCHDRNFFSWGNPGKSINESYVSSNALDIFQISETDGYPTGTTIGNSTFNGTYPTSRFAIGVYNAATYNTALIEDYATKAQYIFVTSDVGPNPYDTVSQYIDDLALHSRSLLGSKQKYNLRQNIAQTSIHKYNSIKQILQSSIQKYNLRQIIISPSIHKYNLRRLIVSDSVQKYNLRVFVAITANIQKYNLRRYLSQTSIQKYNLRHFVAITTNIQKYNLRHYLSQASIQKYNLRQLIAQTSIHKYTIIQVATVIQTSIQKYNLRQYIPQTLVQKYHLRNFVAITPLIQKYNLRQNIIAASIQKYNLWRLVTVSSIQRYNLIQNILAASIQKYNLRQYIQQLSIHKYNMRMFVAISNSIQKYNLRQIVSQTNIHKYTLRNLVAITTNIHKYRLFAAAIQTSIHKYNMRQNIIAASIQKYHIIQVNQVIAVLIAKYNMRQYIVSPSIQKYTLRNFVAVTTNIQKYNMRQNVLLTNIHKYTLRINVAATTSIHKYRLLQNILQTSTQKYNLRALVAITQSIQKYNLRQLVAQTNIQKYRLYQSIITTSTHKYNVLVENMVVAALIAKYNVRQYITVPLISKYYILNTITLHSIHKYSTRQTIIQISTHQYNLIARVLSNSIHKYNLRKIIIADTFHKYNIRQLATATSIHKYNVISVLLVLSQTIHKYNLRRFVIAKSIHKYTVGILKRHLVSMFNAPGKAIEHMKGSKLLQDFLHGEWPV